VHVTIFTISFANLYLKINYQKMGHTMYQQGYKNKYGISKASVPASCSIAEHT
jgi:hypothetical protein